MVVNVLSRYISVLLFILLLGCLLTKIHPGGDVQNVTNNKILEINKMTKRYKISKTQFTKILTTYSERQAPPSSVFYNRGETVVLLIVVLVLRRWICAVLKKINVVFRLLIPPLFPLLFRFSPNAGLEDRG